MEVSFPLLDMANEPRPQQTTHLLDISESENNPKWKITRGKYQDLQIQATILKNGKVTSLNYNPLTDQIAENESNGNLNAKKPEKQIVESFFSLLKTSENTPAYEDKSGNIIHAKHKNVYVVPTSNLWFDSTTKNPIPGLTPPANHDLYAIANQTVL